jgi:hypothetical protein
MPFKVWSIGEEVLAADFNNYVQSQVVSRFASAAARTAAITAPTLNQLTMRDDRPGFIDRWSGTAWADLSVTSQLAYVERTTGLAIPSATTSEGSPTAVVYAPALTFDGVTPIVIDFYVPSVAPGAAAGTAVQFWLYQDGVSMGRIAYVQSVATTGTNVPVFASRRLTPAAGTRTYSVGAGAVSLDGNIYCGVGGTGQYVPAFIRITRV